MRRVLPGLNPKHAPRHKASGGCDDDDSQVKSLASVDHGSIRLTTESPSSIGMFIEGALVRGVNGKLSSGAVSSITNQRIVASEAIAPPNSPTSKHRSSATHHGVVVTSLKKVARSLKENCAQEQQKEAKNELQEKRLPQRISNKKRKKVIHPTMGGPSRRSSRLGQPQGSSLAVLQIEKKQEESRVLAVLDVWEGFRLRVVSDESNEHDEPGEPSQGSAKKTDTKKSTKKSSSVSDSKAFDGLHPGSVSKTQKSIADIPKKFPVILYNMICDAHGEDPSIMRWDSGGATFTIDPNHRGLPSFLGKYFNHNKYSSFRRQLTAYGWRPSSRDRGSKYRHTFFNPLFHRDKSSEYELSQIYRGYMSPVPAPNLDSLAIQDYPALNASSSLKSQRLMRSSGKLNPVSQGDAAPNSVSQGGAAAISEMKPPLISIEEEEESIETAGVWEAISEMLLNLKSPPAVKTKEDTSPNTFLSPAQQGLDVQFDSPLNCFGMLTPTDETVFTSDVTNKVPARFVPPEVRWNVHSDLNGCTTIRQVDEVSDLSTETPIPASEIFHTPSVSLEDLAAFCLDSFSMHTIKSICSEWNAGRSSSISKGFQRYSPGSLMPIIKTLDTTFKSTDPRCQSTAKSNQQHSQNFEWHQRDDVDSTPCTLLRGSCAQFSPLVPKFNPSGWAVLFPEACSHTEEDVTVP